MAGEIYGFTVKSITGEPRNLGEYRGRVLLIVNTASECGYTPQYQGLEALQQAQRAAGLRVLGFPCDDFGHQEPGSEGEIQAFCRRNYGVSFDLFAKVHAKGEGQEPLYRWLTEASGFPGPITWNFNKFLVGKDGTVLARWDSKVKPESEEVAKAVREALQA